MDFLGVDGCKGGWLAVKLSLFGDWEVNLFRSFAATVGEALRRGLDSGGHPHRLEARQQRQTF